MTTRLTRPGSSPRREKWPLIGVVSGVTGFLATIIFDIHVETDGVNTMAVVDNIDQRAAHFSIILGYLTVALLLVLAASWRGAVETQLPDSNAARVVPLALTASAGALSLGYGWKGAMAIYAADGNEPNTYDQMGLYIYYLLNDFGAYIGWLGVTVAAGAIVWLALRERALPLWIGIWSCLPVLAVLAATGATGLPGFPGVVAQIWMVVTFGGMALHQTEILSSNDSLSRQSFAPASPLT